MRNPTNLYNKVILNSEINFVILQNINITLAILILQNKRYGPLQIAFLLNCLLTTKI